MKKQWISVLLLLSILCGMLPLTAQAAGNPFADVPASEYYYDAVLWAVEKGVTSGTDANHFSPDAQCTRAQVATFLWRALGKPESSGSCPFTDVKSNQYYYSAVLWAVQAGVTVGTSDTTFSPEDVVTRAQFVTFLWRALGKPASSGEAGFTDVKTGQYYYDAVLWAAGAGVTAGTGAGRFSPDQKCLRSQTVTFLYRALGGDTPGQEEPTEPTNPTEPVNPPHAPVESITVSETVSRTVKLTYWGDDAYWRFEVNLKNETDKPVTVTKITIQDLCAGNDVYAPHVADMDALNGMFDLTADPGETIQWVDDLPVVYCVNGRRYTMELEDTAGNTFVRTYIL
ncbi:MAG: S-layer homology domain-containing protein, partial [Faecousia sp.]